MDARITKQRLANMLSYDWLKILGAIALAATILCVFFVMIATRATDGQTFYVYAYDGLYTGKDFSNLENDLLDKHVFGYDVLKTGSESFKKSGLYGDSVFMARRSAGEGRVMFVNDVRTTNDEGKVSSTLIDSFFDDEGTEQESFALFLDPEVFLNDCEKYLVKFFGEKLDSEEPNEAETRKTFLERNGKDKRYRTEAKKEAGILDEVKRLKKLRDDYLAVKAELNGKLPFATYTTEIKTHKAGFSMDKLNLTGLVYHTVEQEEEGVKTESQSNQNIALCIFNNGDREGDLKYETVNFLAYLLRYGTAQ